MKLGKAANYFPKSTFSVYDTDTNSWVSLWNNEQISGRISPVDRFLSNFSRPLHRRMLVCDTDTVIPPSSTLRHDVTNDIYVVGQGRWDSYSSDIYQALYMMHLVTGLAGGLGVLTRKAPIGPANDPGHLVESVIGSYYMDLELRATTPEEGTEHLSMGQYFLMAPPECALQEWDFVTLNGETFRIEEGYFDSGLRFARVDKTGDDRTDLVYIKITGSAYDVTQGVNVTTTVDYNVTGAVHNYKKISIDTDRVAENTFKVIVQTDHIGFDPTPREIIRVYGADHSILQVTRDSLKQEWVLICQA